MKKAPFKFIKTKLSNEEMQFIVAGNSGSPTKHSQKINHQSNGQNRERIPHSLSEAYRRLSRRECEVLEKIAEGKSNREIAEELFITKSTVGNHITRIGKSLRLQGRGRLRQWVAQKKSK